MDTPKNPKHLSMTVIPISAPGVVYHHQTGPLALNPDFLATINVGNLADLLLMEQWKGQCEIIPNYVAPYDRSENPKPIVVVRYHTPAQNERQEDSYSYLRYSYGPRQGFFWDCYGDDLGSPELALMALHQAPAPVYTGPAVFRFSTTRKESDSSL